MEHPRRHKTAVEFAVDEIKRRIVEQALKPGTRIDQNVIAETLGLSRIPVRQALAILAARGFVLLQAHRSAAVAPLSRDELHDIYTLRSRMEPWAIEEACERFGESEFAALEGFIETMVQAAQSHDLVRYMDKNREFHFAIFAGSKNPHLVRMLQGLFDISERYQWVYVNALGSMDRSSHEHREIVALMRRRDHKSAIELAVRHCQKTAEWLQDNVLATIETDTSGEPERATSSDRLPA